MEALLVVPRALFLRAPRPLRRRVLRAFGKLPPTPVAVAPAHPSPWAPPIAPESPDQFNRSYTTGRPDLVARLPRGRRSILDLGCATGEVGLALRSREPEARITGVEIDPEMAGVATSRLDRVLTVDLERPEALSEAFVENEFDGVIAGDILEHLTDPWRTLRYLSPYVEPGGWIAASLPNVGFWATWRDVVLHHRWPYRARGVHDATHLRFFARRNIEPLFEQAGFEVVRVDRSARLSDRADHRYERHAAKLARIAGLRDLLTYQFLVVARRRPADAPDPRPLIGQDTELLPPDARGPI